MDKFKSDFFKTTRGDKITITFIKHASLVINFNDRTIYVDPISEYADFTKFPKADIILITHEHYDHFDKKAIKDLTKEGTVVVLNSNSQKLLGYGIVMSNGDHLNLLDSVSIDAVPAYNTTPDHLQFHPNGRDNGYILTLNTAKIYIAGDTEDISEMKNISNIDIAFLPVNQPYTMTTEQAVRAAKIIKPKVLYPYHYSDTKIEKIADLLKDEKDIDVRIRDME